MTYVTPGWYAPLSWALIAPGAALGLWAIFWFWPRNGRRWRWEIAAVLFTAAGITDYYGRLIERLWPGQIPLQFSGLGMVVWSVSTYVLMDAALVAWLIVYRRNRRDK